MVEIPSNIYSDLSIEAPQFEQIQRNIVNCLLILQRESEKIVYTYDKVCVETDARTKDDFLESMNSRINRIAQAFMDVMTFIEIESDRTPKEYTLRYLISQYEHLDYDKSEVELKAVEYLNTRNDIVHDYFTASKLNNDMVSMMFNYRDGFEQMAKNLKTYCYKQYSLDKLEKKIKTNRKKKDER